jgi:hypothetical protein
MMGFTGDNQIRAELVAARDSRFGVNSDRKKADRADIDTPVPLPGADAWQTGKIAQIADPNVLEAARAAIPAH